MRFNEKDHGDQKANSATDQRFNYIVYEDYDTFCKARVTYRIVLTLL